MTISQREIFVSEIFSHTNKNKITLIQFNAKSNDFLVITSMPA